MKILVVQESDWLEKGPHQSHHLMERLSTRGHQVRVIDFEILWRREKNRKLYSKRQVFRNVGKAIKGGSITVIRPGIIKLPVLEYLSLIYSHWDEIIRQVDYYKPDIIVGFGILNAYLAIRIARARNIPFVYYIIDELFRLVPQSYFQDLAKLIEQDNMRTATHVISINEMLRDYTIKMGAPGEKTSLIGAGVDLEHFSCTERDTIRRQLGFEKDDVVLFFMGWLYEFSGLKEIVTQLASMEETNIKLLVLGKGDLWDTLQEFKKKRHMKDRLITIGWKPFEEIPKYIAGSDICLLPSRKEKLMMNIVPIKMYEYMAAGKPVIATNLPGIMKEFGKDSGVLYIDHPDDVIPTVHKMMQNNQMKSMGETARIFVEKRDWTQVTDRFETLLMNVIAQTIDM